MEDMVAFEELKNIYRGKKVLLTGSTGFKGSWLSIMLLHLGAEVYGYALAPEKGSNFEKCKLGERIHQKYGDVRDLEALNSFVQEVKPDYAFHLAAQALVIDGYNDPRYTFDVNLMGTVNFFEALRKCSDLVFAVNVTSDKSYKNNEWDWSYREDEAMGGDDPYSASKGASELISHAYLKSFFSSGNCAVATARAGNVIGGGDWAENRIVPDIFRAIYAGEELTLRNPEAVRPWQYVLEPLSGYLHLGKKLVDGRHEFSGAWNFGPEDHVTNTVEKLVKAILSSLNKSDYPLDIKEGKHHEATLLKLDISRAKAKLDWCPLLDFRDTISFTVQGYKDEQEDKDLFSARMKQVGAYFQRMKKHE